MTSVDALLAQDALQAAPALLGWELVSHQADGTVSGRIVEVEAYHGAEDPASHAFRGLTPRTAPMFEAGGAIYLYLSYGLHTCLNLVTGPAGQAQAVLIRALEPTSGLELMRARRRQTNSRLLTSGPGRVGQALGLSVALSGQRLGQSLELRPPAAPVPATAIASGPRIGITSAVGQPWRFWLADSLYVSKTRRSRVE
jgi:DNA-3-methyladenine glycosylase